MDEAERVAAFRHRQTGKNMALKALFDDSVSTETVMALAWDAGYEDFNDFLKAVGA